MRSAGRPTSDADHEADDAAAATGGHGAASPTSVMRMAVV